MVRYYQTYIPMKTIANIILAIMIFGHQYIFCQNLIPNGDFFLENDYLPDTTYLNLKHKKNSLRINGNARFYFRTKNWKSIDQFKFKQYYPSLVNMDEYFYPNICDAFNVSTFGFANDFECDDTTKPQACITLFYDNFDSRALSHETPGKYSSPLLFNTLVHPVEPNQKYALRFKASLSLDGFLDNVMPPNPAEVMKYYPLKIILSNQNLNQIGYDSMVRDIPYNYGATFNQNLLYNVGGRPPSFSHYCPTNYRISGDTWTAKSHKLVKNRPRCNSVYFHTFLDTLTFSQYYKYIYIGLFASNSEMYTYGELSRMPAPPGRPNIRYFKVKGISLTPVYDPIHFNDTILCAQDSITLPFRNLKLPLTFYKPQSKDSITGNSTTTLPVVNGKWTFRYGAYSGSFTMTNILKNELKNIDTSFCEESQLFLDLENKTNGNTYWVKTKNSELLTNEPGKYLAIVNNHDCLDSIYFNVVKNPKPKPSFTRLDTNCSVHLGPKIFRYPKVAKTSSWWVFNRHQIDQNPIQIKTNGLLKLISINEFYCSDSVALKIEDQCNAFHIPNVFSPNNDNKNEVFKPISIGCTLLSLRIINRWGQEVYRGADAWDGTYENKPCIEGCYVYQISMQRDQDNTFHYYSGTLQLLR